MHLSDALLSAPVALSADAVAAALIGVAAAKVKKEGRDNIVPLMGVAGAFIFAAQMVNFAIPGTGSSGHIVGGVLLAALLGPWAGFLTLASVLIIQCLIFADGGLMALGCNLINMGAMTALLAYPLVFLPFAGASPSGWRIMSVSVLACVAGLEAGACMVTLETVLSGITALPFRQFLTLMTAIHLPIGLVEGMATGAVLIFVAKYRPDIFGTGAREPMGKETVRRNTRHLVLWLAVATLLIAGGLAFLASADPDGLEWSIERIAGTSDIVPEHVSALSTGAGRLQEATSVMPDYDNTFAGIAGAVITLVLAGGLSSLLIRKK